MRLVTRGVALYTNAQVAELCALSPRLIGFASVDPHQASASEELTRAVEQLGLHGLKLDPSLQEFYPDDRAVYPIYERAQALRIPVLFHAGMTWEPGARLKYSHPLRFEDVAADFPKLKIVLAHLAWPWVVDAVALALKYPNVHLDTSALYFDNPQDFIQICHVPTSSSDRIRAQPAPSSRFWQQLSPRRNQKHGAGCARSGFQPGLFGSNLSGECGKVTGSVSVR